MPPDAGWTPRSAVAACPIAFWSGSVWRGHSRRRTATDDGGSRQASGRWHIGEHDPDYGGGPAWPALYTSLEMATCAFEIQRIIVRRGGSLRQLRSYRYTELWVQLEAVIDFRSASTLGLTDHDLTRDDDCDVPRAIANAARALGVEAMLVPSTSGVGDNLIIFLDRRRPGSVLQVVRSVDPRLGQSDE